MEIQSNQSNTLNAFQQVFFYISGLCKRLLLFYISLIKGVIRGHKLKCILVLIYN